MTTESAWAGVRAALASWRAPKGFRLHHAIDQRAGRIAVSLVAECGTGDAWDADRLDNPGAIDRLARALPVHLDRAAFTLLYEHICCGGRLPRAIRRAGRHFEEWADDYRFLRKRGA